MAFVPSALRLGAAVSALRCGGVVACPTEAVWGLSCDPYNRQAVERLLALKYRPQSKGLILVAATAMQLDFLLHDLPREARTRLTASWPGPTTWLLPHRGRVPHWIFGAHDTVAVRVSAHPVLAALASAWGGPLVSTSANPAGARPARHAFQVRRYFGDKLDNILPGSIGNAHRPTTIRELFSERILRI